MSAQLNLDDLVHYTDWERQQWQVWFGRHGQEVLKISAGAHGDGRFQTIGDLLRHVFSAEKRYIERLAERPLTDTAAIPNDNIDALFQFGQQSRQAFKEFLASFPLNAWDVPAEFKMMNNSLTATPRKILVHVLLHEIRHWAQIATLVRLNGLAVEFHDFLFSPVLGGEFKGGKRKA